MDNANPIAQALYAPAIKDLIQQRTARQSLPHTKSSAKEAKQRLLVPTAIAKKMRITSTSVLAMADIMELLVTPPHLQVQAPLPLFVQTMLLVTTVIAYHQEAVPAMQVMILVLNVRTNYQPTRNYVKMDTQLLIAKMDTVMLKAHAPAMAGFMELHVTPPHLQVQARLPLFVQTMLLVTTVIAYHQEAVPAMEVMILALNVRVYYQPTRNYARINIQLLIVKMVIVMLNTHVHALLVILDQLVVRKHQYKPAAKRIAIIKETV